MIPGEQRLSELAVRKKLGEWRGGKIMHHNTLRRVLARTNFPKHEDPFSCGHYYYWSEIQEWLSKPQPKVKRKTAPVIPGRRGPGRPRKNPSNDEPPVAAEGSTSNHAR